MHGDQIRNACEQAAALARAVKEPQFQGPAFGVILEFLLSRADPSALSGRTSSAPKPAAGKGSRKPGLKSRLEDLIEDGFFSEPRTSSEIAVHLKLAGWIHQSKEISARLIELTRSKRLRRAGDGAELRYSNW